MKTDRPVTVVLYIQDEEKFKPMWDKFFQSMIHDEEIDGAYVTGLSVHDEMSRLEELENK